MRPIVYDTDVASAEIKRRLPSALAAKLAGRSPVLTFVGQAELLEWTFGRNWGSWKRAQFDRWFIDVPTLPGDPLVAQTYARLSFAAKSRGRPRPMNDMWVASCCLAHDLPLATLNVKDFDDFRIHHGLEIVTA
ncbi:type II toxin-antitoxin system VapC family toxin [Actinoplanes derwentensis]|uniref:PIN domain-containing protein n=1 Tax=Actinoplanes derwentensis TaxID=113562 RepID=A0A1H2D6D3_9ACTN|nr:type II toxin-antitoxin system VapC family toxin [Actinoplanes derwentensis]GID85572.1 hypothetical protein Ade03nite_44960 [Actinoplanes derwentensis]SDT78315.1 hypothetical protein SAMN04489716_8320 [Actinoplanes derwentensis]